MIVAVIDDLMMRSRVSTATKGTSTDVRFVSGEEQIVALASSSPSPSLFIVDLNSRGIDPLALISRFKTTPALSTVRVLGFVSHVDVATIAAARAAGIDEVVARSAFVDHLPDVIAGIYPSPHTSLST
jgi:PleD family two-component response regulator